MTKRKKRDQSWLNREVKASPNTPIYYLHKKASPNSE